MSLFRDQVRKLLSEYKVLMKKYLPSDKRALHFRLLGVDRYNLKYVNEPGLYQAAEKVLADLNERIVDVEQNGTWFSGLDEFRQCLANLMEQYYLDDNQVVHGAQRASQAMIRAIQLMTININQLQNDQYNELEKLSREIYRFGSREQKQLFLKALRTQSDKNPNALLPLLDRFEIKHQQPVAEEHA